MPCFLWIFLGAPYVERLRDNAALSGAMTAITAAVVGVVLNLAVWFGLHVMFAEVDEWRGAGLRLLIPDLASLDVAALLLSLAAMLAIFRYGVGMLKVLGACALAGVLLSLL
ncbi:chromate transporter [Halomonas sp. E19]|uniref:chromate transporter n=1 Tax=Halomonas sp. E19 TaxID=3397247 RepID=UPI004033E09F